MITVKIEEEDLLDMLLNRLKYWTTDKEDFELYEQYYDHMINDGCFGGAEINIMSIVDNDWVNNLSIVTREEFDKSKNDFLKDEIKEWIKENENYYEDDKEFKEQLKSFLNGLKDENPDFDDLECGENEFDWLDGYYIEAKTDNQILVSY